MVQKFKIKSKVDNLRIIEKAIDELTALYKISPDYYGNIMVSVMEAVNNAIVHGNKLNARKNVEVEMSIEGDFLEVIVKDGGKGFNPELIPDPTSPENIQNVDGRGIFIMSKLSDGIEFNERGNIVTLSFKNILS